MAYDLIDLELFVHVVDAGSITRGAEKVHLSLASASARIGAMERALGTPLLTRHRRGVAPSAAGWLLIAHARGVLGQVARMRSELARVADGLRSTLTVLGNTSAVETFAPAALTAFASAHPDVDIDLAERPSHEIVTAVEQGRCELGLIADSVDVGSLTCTVLHPDPLVVVAPVGHPLAARDPIPLSTCLEHPFVGFVDGNPLQDHLNGRAEPLGLRPRYRARLPGTEAICRAVAAGVGIAVLPARAASRWGHELDLGTVALANTWARRNQLLCHRDRAALSEPAAALVQHLVDVSDAADGS